MVRRNKISVARRPRGRRPQRAPPPPASRLGGSPPGGPPPPPTAYVTARRCDIAARHAASCLTRPSRFLFLGRRCSRVPAALVDSVGEWFATGGPHTGRAATPATSAVEAQSPVKAKANVGHFVVVREDSAGSDCRRRLGRRVIRHEHVGLRQCRSQSKYRYGSRGGSGSASATGAPSQPAQGQAATSAQMVTDGAPSRSGVKPAAPPKAIPTNIFAQRR
ncbi:hypothetical protein EVAR_38924_1 [Eumeta japonica]|uniref:Uncharacterized protein n=1 Tax=Eumeta variegata TaxID=151549 RepID=A0A4C1ZQI9_EUMVA|nr:hypothetical protein EVAR_38924_1 [Eumeta japonica]